MKKLIIVLLLAANFVTLKAENYAILISAGEATTDDAFSNSEYWYDLFLAYEDLIINEGYTHDNIFVFYGDGTDFTGTQYNRFKGSLHGWTNQIVDFDNAYSTMNTQMANIGNIITGDDNLHIRWVVGHGGTQSGNYMPTDPDDYKVLIQNRSSYISDTQLFAMFDQISNYKRRKVIWMTCLAGCVEAGNESFNNNRTVVIASSRWNQNSQAYFQPNGYNHAQLNYVLTSSLYGEDPIGNVYDGDHNNDDEISMDELFDEAVASTIMTSDAQLGDDCSYATRIFMDEDLELNTVSINGNQEYWAEGIFVNNSFDILNGASATFIADNNTIRFGIGFHARAGSQMHAFLGDATCNRAVFTAENPDSDDELNSTNENDYMESLAAETHENNSTSLNIFPNPNNGTFNILQQGIEIERIDIINFTGQVIYTQTNVSEMNSKINISEYPDGVYFVRIKTSSEIVSQKIIKK